MESKGKNLSFYMLLYIFKVCAYFIFMIFLKPSLSFFNIGPLQSSQIMSDRSQVRCVNGENATSSLYEKMEWAFLSVDSLNCEQRWSLTGAAFGNPK